MHTSDQSPEEPQQPASQPLYEFPAETAATPPEAGAQEAPEQPVGERVELPAFQAPSVQPPAAEEIAPGLVYPPPPSFYENIPASAPRPPLPPRAPATSDTPPFAFPPPVRSAPPAVAPLAPGQMPPGYGSRPVARRSRAWIWIVVSIFAFAALAFCGLCVWIGYATVGQSMRQIIDIEASGRKVANDYYSALQAKNYSLAYSYLHPQDSITGLSEQQFVQKAQDQDSKYGSVLSYAPGTPSVTQSSLSGADITHFTISVEVNRQNLRYTALLTFRKIGSQWKITDFDRI